MVHFLDLFFSNRSQQQPQPAKKPWILAFKKRQVASAKHQGPVEFLVLGFTGFTLLIFLFWAKEAEKFRDVNQADQQ